MAGGLLRDGGMEEKQPKPGEQFDPGAPNRKPEDRPEGPRPRAGRPSLPDRPRPGEQLGKGRGEHDDR